MLASQHATARARGELAFIFSIQGQWRNHELLHFLRQRHTVKPQSPHTDWAFVCFLLASTRVPLATYFSPQASEEGRAVFPRGF